MTILSPKATITTVHLGHLEFEGLMLDTGEFGIAASQANDILQFSASQKLVSRDIKRLLDGSFSASKWRTTRNSNALNILRLIDFERLIRVLDKKTSCEILTMPPTLHLSIASNLMLLS